MLLLCLCPLFSHRPSALLLYVSSLSLFCLVYHPLVIWQLEAFTNCCLQDIVHSAFNSSVSFQMWHFAAQQCGSCSCLDVTSYSLVDMHWCYSESCCIHCYGGGSRILWNVSMFLLCNMLSHHISSLVFVVPLLWEPYISLVFTVRYVPCLLDPIILFQMLYCWAFAADQVLT